MKTSRTTLPLREQDREAIAAIRAHYGVGSDADAIRIALRELYRRITSEAGPQPITPQKDSPSPPCVEAQGPSGSER